MKKLLLGALLSSLLSTSVFAVTMNCKTGMKNAGTNDRHFLIYGRSGLTCQNDEQAVNIKFRGIGPGSFSGKRNKGKIKLICPHQKSVKRGTYLGSKVDAGFFVTGTVAAFQNGSHFCFLAGLSHLSFGTALKGISKINVTEIQREYYK